MKIVGAAWGKKVNYLVVECDCLHRFHHPSNRWEAKCRCGKTSNLAKLRARYVDEKLSAKEDNA